MAKNPRLRGPVPPGVLRLSLSLQEPWGLHVLQKLHRQAVQGKPLKKAHLHGRQEDAGRRRGLNSEGL